jgi:hypothetical protein
MSDYLPHVPRALIHRYEHPNSFKGKDILRRLLTDPRMKRTWKMLEKRCTAASDYTRLWSQINHALAKSRTAEPSRTKRRDDFLGVVRDAEQLAKDIDNGLLDRLAYEYFPDYLAQSVFRADQWPVLGPDDRYRSAHRRIALWPSITDLLAEVARHAERCAKEAMRENRVVERDTRDRELNYFVRYLAKYFRTHLKGPMEGSLANIASVVFEKAIDQKHVKQALRHEKGGA